MTTEINTINPKSYKRFLVKTVVCVKKPGPIADVAIKIEADQIAEPLFFIDINFQRKKLVSNVISKFLKSIFWSMDI